MVLKVYLLNGLSNILMFLVSLQEPLTSNIKKKKNKWSPFKFDWRERNVFL